MRYVFLLKDPSIPNPDEFDETGSEFYPATLFGEHEQMYLALMLDRLNHDKLDPELYLPRMIRAHINRGVIALKLQELMTFLTFMNLSKMRKSMSELKFPIYLDHHATTPVDPRVFDADETIFYRKFWECI